VCYVGYHVFLNSEMVKYISNSSVCMYLKVGKCYLFFMINDRCHCLLCYRLNL